MKGAILVLAVLGMVGCGGGEARPSDPECSPCGGGQVGAYVDGVTVCYECPTDRFVAPGLVCSRGREAPVPP